MDMPRLCVLGDPSSHLHRAFHQPPWRYLDLLSPRVESSELSVVIFWDCGPRMPEPIGRSRSLMVQPQHLELSTNKIPFRFPFLLTLNSASLDFSASFLESEGVSSKRTPSDCRLFRFKVPNILSARIDMDLQVPTPSFVVLLGEIFSKMSPSTLSSLQCSIEDKSRNSRCRAKFEGIGQVLAFTFGG